MNLERHIKFGHRLGSVMARTTTNIAVSPRKGCNKNVYRLLSRSFVLLALLSSFILVIRAITSKNTRNFIEQPYSLLDCKSKITFGDDYGGWTLCRPKDRRSFRDAIVYTVGIGRNIKWDEEMIHRFSTIHHGWDPTPTAQDFFKHRSIPERFNFHRYGLGSKDGPVTLKLPEGNFDSYTVMEYSANAKEGMVIKVDMLTVQSMMKMLNHRWVAVLKVDIEGAEFDVIQSWYDNKFVIPADQLLIEFHERYFSHDSRAPDMVPLAMKQLSYLGFKRIHHTKLVSSLTLCSHLLQCKLLMPMRSFLRRCRCPILEFFAPTKFLTT